MAGVYIHIPFCKQACHYCDFHFSTNQQIKKDLVDAIVKETRRQQHYLNGEPIETIYFGGGTPSLLSKEEIGLILEAVYSTQNVITNPEITLEANPDDLSPGHLKELFDIGINRLSIGIQSFHTDLLKFLNRAHDGSTAIRCFQHARAAGFRNISIDLIYAIPGERDNQWTEDIRQAIELDPEHISCYSLTIEEKTVFGKWSMTGKIKPTEDETASRHLETLMAELELAGYEHYEISNFAKPGFYSNHNSSYWRAQKYLGIGPSAHSFDGVSRQFNISNNSLYIKSVNRGQIPYEREELSRANKINEYILTTLRTNWGTDLKKIKHEFDYDLRKENIEYLTNILENGLVILEADVLKLTKKGKLLADKISSDLFVFEHDD
jgi:oxygen-independent coproporphyrinogen III oxidase